MSERRVNFANVPSSASAQTKTIILTRGDGGPPNPKLKPIESPNIKAQIREIEAGKRYELDISLEPPFTSERIRTTLTLETGVAEAPIATIPIYAMIVPRVTTSPKRIMMPGKARSNWKQNINVVWSESTPHKILGAKVDDPKLKARVEESKGKQRVILELAGDDWPEPGLRTITIETDDAEAPTVLVPLTVGGKAKSATTIRSTTATSKVESKSKETKPETTKPPVTAP